jgi:hypothetical protein
MNTHPRARRAAAAAALLGTLALVAACGSSSSDEKAPASSRSEQARKFSQCMRSNGLPDFPDPDANGELRGPGHEQEDSPEFRAAQEKCRDLAPGGEHQNTGDPAFVEQMRKFSQCMRANGLPDFPDPDANGQLRGAGHEQERDPKYRAATKTCRKKLPGGGAHQ